MFLQFREETEVRWSQIWDVWLLVQESETKEVNLWSLRSLMWGLALSCRRKTYYMWGQILRIRAFSFFRVPVNDGARRAWISNALHHQYPRGQWGCTVPMSNNRPHKITVIRRWLSTFSALKIQPLLFIPHLRCLLTLRHFQGCNSENSCGRTIKFYTKMRERLTEFV
jgi:hypothetical protein